MSSSDLLADLTEDQQNAVSHGEGPLLILAGPGSGKTRVITRRVAYLVQQGVRPSNILAITFTNKAAGEMRKRIDAIVPGSRIWVCTFHSLGARLLRIHADRLGIDRNFTIYDTSDRNQIVKSALEASGMDNVKFSPEQIGSAISKAKNLLLTPPKYERSVKDYFQQIVAQVYSRYDALLRAANAMDFDDLLYLPALALQQNEELRAELDARFRYVLIDEYQDTNFAQYEIARLLSLNYQNLCVVGDADQSIYRWRGSDIKNILDFERDYPNASVITLSRNYRSTKAILNTANALIGNNTNRKKKTLTTENPQGEPVRVLTFDNGIEEAEGIVMRIKEAVQQGRYRYRDHAIFLRINALSRLLEGAFVKHGVPFQIVKGFAFFERKENKDILGYLRLLANPQDTISFLRVINEPTRGVGKTSVEKLQAYAQRNELSLFDAASQVAKIPEIKGKAATGIQQFYRLITNLRSELERPPHELIRMVIEQSGYGAMLKDARSDESAEQLENIEELITAAKEVYDEDNSRTLTDFLEKITLAADVDSWEDSADRVSVMTLHSSKGLEFPVVYLMAVEQNLLPHERSLSDKEEMEEERRLCFVGMTRAMNELYLSHSRLREFRGRTLYMVRSIFLDELQASAVSIDHVAGKNTARHAVDEWRSRAGYAGDSAAASALDRPRSTGTLQSTGTGSTGGDYSVGQVVQHEEYGIGQITNVSGFGALRRIKIRFPSAGEKTFVADKVKLKVAPRK